MIFLRSLEVSLYDDTRAVNEMISTVCDFLFGAGGTICYAQFFVKMAAPSTISN